MNMNFRVPPLVFILVLTTVAYILTLSLETKETYNTEGSNLCMWVHGIYRVMAPREVPRSTVSRITDVLERYFPARYPFLKALNALAERGAYLLVVPAKRDYCEYPEFEYLLNQRTDDGRTWCDVRGITNETVCAIPEESSNDTTLIVHEFAHAVHLGYLVSQRPDLARMITSDYEKCPGDRSRSYMMSNELEFFATLCQQYVFGEREQFRRLQGVLRVLRTVFGDAGVSNNPIKITSN